MSALAAAMGCVLLGAACGPGAPRPGATPATTAPGGLTTTSPSRGAASTAWSAPVATVNGRNLKGVSCASTDFCVVIDGSGRVYTFIAGRWAAGSSLDPTSATTAAQTFVSCPSTALCMAVPGGNDTAVGKGSAYGPVWAPAVALSGAQRLQSLSCSSPTFCATVDGEGGSFTYDGARWSATSGAWGGASALSCVSPTFCVATEGGGIARWNGSAWSQPGSQDQVGQLLSVSCTSATFCVAGDSDGSVVLWNGSTWSRPTTVDHASGASADNMLAGMSCVGSTFCMATDSGGRAVTFDGSTWSTPVRVGSGAALNAVSCVSPTFCVAVDAAGKAYTYR